MFIFRPPSKKKSKCTFLQESQESLKDEVFQERIFAQDVNGVAVREERHRLSARVLSAPSGSKAWGCPWCRGLGCPPVRSLSLQTWEEAQEPAWAGQCCKRFPTGGKCQAPLGNSIWASCASTAACDLPSRAKPPAQYQLRRVHARAPSFTDFTKRNTNEARKVNASPQMAQLWWVSQAMLSKYAS